MIALGKKRINLGNVERKLRHSLGAKKNIYLSQSEFSLMNSIISSNFPNARQVTVLRCRKRSQSCLTVDRTGQRTGRQHLVHRPRTHNPIYG
jgi:hypothetical protein